MASALTAFRSRLVSRQLVPLTARAYCSTSDGSARVQNVVVLGSGLMGGGIAREAAHRGNYKVTLVDIDQDVVTKNRNRIAAGLMKDLARENKAIGAAYTGAVSLALSNLHTSIDLAAAVKDADLVIEGVTENMELKKSIFKTVDEHAPAHCVVVSNTSSLSITEMAEVVSADRRTKFGGLHFFSPVERMQLIEVVRTENTSDSTNELLHAFGRSLQKVTVQAKDTPGFIVNRLLIPYLMESIRMYEREEASKEDVDTAMKLGAGYPMGPFTLLDFVGLDVVRNVIKGWHESFPDRPEFAPSPLVEKLYDEGKLGMKTGEGFYKHKK